MTEVIAAAEWTLAAVEENSKTRDSRKLQAVF
jgi:hypothetical protein